MERIPDCYCTSSRALRSTRRTPKRPEGHMQRSTMVVMLMVVIAGNLRGPRVEAVDAAGWIAATTKEMETFRLHLSKPMPQRPATLVIELMQQSDACYASFNQLYEDPKFNVIGEGDFTPLWNEQIALAKAMIAHEMV